MFRALAIFCILIHGWLAAAGGPLVLAGCGPCARQEAMTGTPSHGACCECCPGGMCATAAASCCCDSPVQTPQTPTPSRTLELLEQLGRLAATPVSMPALTVVESAPMPRPSEHAFAAAPSAHLARVIATTHLLV